MRKIVCKLLALPEYQDVRNLATKESGLKLVQIVVENNYRLDCPFSSEYTDEMIVRLNNKYLCGDGEAWGELKLSDKCVKYGRLRDIRLLGAFQIIFR